MQSFNIQDVPLFYRHAKYHVNMGLRFFSVLYVNKRYIARRHNESNVSHFILHIYIKESNVPISHVEMIILHVNMIFICV